MKIFQRMETIVRKMGAGAPDDDTQKRRLIDGLRDPDAQKFVGLQRPANLATAKQEARNWEEVQLRQQRRRKLLHGPIEVTTSTSATKGPKTTTGYSKTQP